jgi:hypothetical protein
LALNGIELTREAMDAVDTEFTMRQLHAPCTGLGELGSFEFVPSDISELVPRVKCLHFIDVTLARRFHAESLQRQRDHGIHDQQSKRLVRRARVHLERARRSMPASKANADLDLL